MLFIIFGDTVYILLKRMKFLVKETKLKKNTGKWEKKMLEKSGNFVSLEK